MFKLHITSSIGRHLPLDHLCHIPFGSVHKGTQRTDVICQRLAFRDVVYLHILLINLSRQHHIHLSQTRFRCQCVRVHIPEIPIDLTHYRIKSEALLYRHLHILPEPFLLPGLPTFIRGFSQSVRIMFYSLLLRHPKRRSELRIRHESRVSPESIKCRDIPLNENLKQPHIHELHRIRHNALKKLLIPPVATHLLIAILLTCYQNRIKPQSILQHIHPRIKTQLPLRIHHILRNGHGKLDVHLAAPLRNIPEPGSHRRRLKHVRRHHISILIPHSIHNNRPLIRCNQSCISHSIVTPTVMPGLTGHPLIVISTKRSAWRNLFPVLDPIGHLLHHPDLSPHLPLLHPLHLP